MVEGQPSRRFSQDMAKDGLRVFQDFYSRDPQGLDPSVLQPPIPGLVVLRSVAPRMRLSVNLDCQPRIAAEEVENIESGRMLTPEL